MTMGRLFGYAALSAVLSLLSACSHDAGLGSDRRGTAGTGGTNGGAGGTGTTGGNGFAASGNFMNTGFDSGLANSDGAASDSSSTVVLTFPDGAVSGGVKLVCTPGSLLVSGAAATIKCSVLLENGSAAPNVVWIVDDTRIGSIGQDGVFSANGFVGGVVKVTANIGTATISTSLTIDVVIQNNIDGITPADITKLAAGGSADGSFGWLYPYDKTVFPRGLQPPELQFSGGCADSTYLKITYPHYVYEQAAAGTSPLRVTIPDAVWRGLTLTSTGSDLVKVSVSKLCAGQVTGPINESWLIAPGKMKGAVYYTTYGSKVFIDPATKLPLAGAFRIRLGSYTEPYIAGCTTCNTGCTVCHSVSANGGVLGSGWNWGGGRGEPDLSKTFDLTSSAIPPPELGSTDNGLIFAWPGLTPDGKRALTNGVPQMGTQLKKIGAGAGIPAVLVDTTTVQVIPSSLPVKFMQTPAFSPDSLHVAFNNSDLGPGHLSVMDYDGTQNPPVFSNLTDVVQSVS
ncbi:MAG TPA: hypothetical protein VGJ84_23125, partial [Polyangiaceae bacterium]